MNDSTMLFHCSAPVLDDNGNIVIKENGKYQRGIPTHTLVFGKMDSTNMLMAWSVAHSVFDANKFSRKIGRSMAEGRFKRLHNMLMGDEVLDVDVVDGISNEILPSRVVDGNFDYYLTTASKYLFTEEELASGINLVFESALICREDEDGYYSYEDPQIFAININFSEEVDEELVSEKADTGVVGDFIFASFENEDGEVIIHIQHNEYLSEGYSDNVDEDMVKFLSPIVNDGGFLIVDEQKPILVSEDMAEIDVVRYLKSNGLTYSLELENDLVS